MEKANLGSIITLQKQYTPTGVKTCLDRWCKMLGDHHDEDASKCGMTRIVRELLWRDSFGLIPIYTWLLMFGLHFGAKQLRWKDWWPAVDYLWFFLPLTAAIADYTENFFHFRYLSLHDKGLAPKKMMTFVASLMTLLKTITFGVGIAAGAIAILWASAEIAWSPKEYGWRGLVGLSVSFGTILLIVVFAVWGRVYRLLSRIQNPT